MASRISPRAVRVYRGPNLWQLLVKVREKEVATFQASEKELPTMVSGMARKKIPQNMVNAHRVRPAVVRGYLSP